MTTEVQRKLRRKGSRPGSPADASRRQGRVTWGLGARLQLMFGCGIIVLFCIVPLASQSVYEETSAAVAALTIMGVLSVTVLFGWSGQLMFAQGAVFGTSAYISAYLMLHGAGTAIALIAGVLGGAVLGVAMVIPTSRLSGLQVGLLTYALGVAAVQVFSQISGYDGISGIPFYSIGSWQIDTAERQLIVACAALLLVYVGLSFIRNSRLGRRLLLLKEHPSTLASLGVSPIRSRIVVFGIASVVLGLAGALYPAVLGYVGPDAFSVSFVISLLLGAIIGGLTMLEGGLIGGLVVAILPLMLQSHANVFNLANGLAMVVVMVAVPGGIAVGAVVLAKRGSGLVRRKAALVEPSGASDGQSGVVLAVDPNSGKRLSGRVRTSIETLLGAVGVNKSFSGLKALEGVNFELLEGGLVGLIGSNGAGKSTLVDVLTGQQRPDRGGRIAFGNSDVTSTSTARRARMGLVRTFQFPAFATELSVLENLVLGHSTDAAVRSRALEVLQVAELAHLADHEIGSLPFGTQKLIDVCRAITMHPRLLLLDEPAAGMGRGELPMLERLLRLVVDEADATVVVVEHNMEFLMGLADRIIVLDFGHVIAQGSPAEIAANPHVQAAYLGGHHAADEAEARQA